MNIYFKATRKVACSDNDYRQIAKHGEGLAYDLHHRSDDVISICSTDGSIVVNIDCDKHTGEFRLFFDEDNFIKNK